MAKPHHKELVRAHVTGDNARVDALIEAMPAEEWEEFYRYLSAFFALMLEVRLGDSTKLDEIKRLVEEMRYDYRNAEPPIKPLVIEGVVRASLGEDHLLDEIEQADTVRALFLTVSKISGDSPRVVADLDRFLNDAESLASGAE